MKIKQILLSSFLLFAISYNSIAQTVNKDYQDGKIWVKVKSNFNGMISSIEESKNSLAIYNFPFLKSIDKAFKISEISAPFAKLKHKSDLKNVYQITITDIYKIDEAIKSLKSIEGVEYAEKIPSNQATLVPNDPSYINQWALPKINATSAWNLFSTGSNVVVAIVDDAVERTHPDLTANLWVNTGEIASNGIDDDGNGYIDDVNGWDMADNDNNPNPNSSVNDHGTHVAGIAGAVSNNNNGVSSIGYSIKLMCVKVSNDGSSIMSAAYNGILYAVDNGARVINCSWGNNVFSSTAQTIIDYAYDNGVLVIAGAGNSNVNSLFYPAGYNHVIAVAATSSNDVKASFSNFGSWIDVSAPGDNIYSTTIGGTYGYKNGTSMASPLVSGLAGLMLSLNPALTPSDIETCLKNNVDNIDGINSGFAGQLGTGRINAFASMQCVQSSLTWAPVANFSANTTTISAGGSVNFTNLSLYNPTTYTWTFQGGSLVTSNSANPPSITYNTPGTYSVSLKVSNINGTHTKTQLAYITVNPASSCSKINFPIPSGWTITNYTYGAGGVNGFINGVGSNNDKQKAMFFDASSQSGTILQNVLIAFSFANSSNLNKIVPVNIYDGTSGSPGTLLGTSNLTMAQIKSDISNQIFTSISFVNNPITLPVSKKFFVSIDISNLSWAAIPRDSLAIVSNSQGQTVPSAIWEQQNTNAWKQYGTLGSWALNSSLLIHPFMTSQPTDAVITTSTLSVCQGNFITYNPNGSTYQNQILWSLPGASAVGTNTLQPQVLYDTPGIFITKLFVQGGGCSLVDSAEVTITIKANPSLSVTATSVDLCSGATATLNASGASTVKVDVKLKK
jgi:subtilisin family serine protease